MSMTTQDHWTCNRCKSTVKTQHGSRPPGWVSLNVVHPDRNNLTMRSGDLCVECRISFEKWWTDERA